MAWWSSVSSVSKLAHTALKEAQRKLDKVLDIDEDVPQLGDQSGLSKKKLHYIFFSLLCV